LLLGAPVSAAPSSFDTKLSALVADTAVPNWDDNGAMPIPSELWGRVSALAALVRAACPQLLDPDPSAGADGSRHLRWCHRGDLFDVEITYEERLLWASRVGTCVRSGYASDFAQLVAMIAGAFGEPDEDNAKLKERDELRDENEKLRRALRALLTGCVDAERMLHAIIEGRSNALDIMGWEKR
jgi:hypothetical protein